MTTTSISEPPPLEQPDRAARTTRLPQVAIGLFNHGRSGSPRLEQIPSRLTLERPCLRHSRGHGRAMRDPPARGSARAGSASAGRPLLRPRMTRQAALRPRVKPPGADLTPVFAPLLTSRLESSRVEPPSHHHARGFIEPLLHLPRAATTRSSSSLRRREPPSCCLYCRAVREQPPLLKLISQATITPSPQSVAASPQRLTTPSHLSRRCLSAIAPSHPCLTSPLPQSRLRTPPPSNAVAPSTISAVSCCDLPRLQDCPAASPRCCCSVELNCRCPSTAAASCADLPRRPAWLCPTPKPPQPSRPRSRLGHGFNPPNRRRPSGAYRP